MTYVQNIEPTPPVENVSVTAQCFKSPCRALCIITSHKFGLLWVCNVYGMYAPKPIGHIKYETLFVEATSITWCCQVAKRAGFTGIADIQNINTLIKEGDIGKIAFYIHILSITSRVKITYKLRLTWV